VPAKFNKKQSCRRIETRQHTYYHSIHPTETAEADATLARSSCEEKASSGGDAWCRITCGETGADASDIVNARRL
jgi:hypothetical protein